MAAIPKPDAATARTVANQRWPSGRYGWPPLRSGPTDRITEADRNSAHQARPHRPANGRQRSLLGPWLVRTTNLPVAMPAPMSACAWAIWSKR